MTNFQQSLITHLRESIQSKNKRLHPKLILKTDKELAQHIFFNFRDNNHSNGGRLSRFGLNFVKNFFENWVINFPEGKVLSAREVLYIDTTATMPYYLDDKSVTFFEHKLSLMLMMSDGRIDTLMSIT